MQSKKRIASLVTLLSMATLLVATGCNGDGLFGSNQGRLQVTLSADAAGSAAPALDGSAGESSDGGRLSSWFQSASVTLSSVLVRNLHGQLINVDVALPVTVDVVKIEGGKQVVLPAGTLPVGSYDQVVLVITAVEGTTRNGTVITIEPPGGGWTAVVPICQLDVAEGATETVDLTLNVRNSFLQVGSHWDFQPRFRSRLVCAGTP
jgi:hypothetical protein